MYPMAYNGVEQMPVIIVWAAEQMMTVLEHFAGHRTRNLFSVSKMLVLITPQVPGGGIPHRFRSSKEVTRENSFTKFVLA